MTKTCHKLVLGVEDKLEGLKEKDLIGIPWMLAICFKG